MRLNPWRARPWWAWARRGGTHAGAVAWRLLMVLGALELLYVAFANLMLSTRLMRSFVATSHDVHLDYESAYSVIPGRIAARHLSVKIEDHNIQALVTIEHASLDLSLHELFLRRFHVLRVEGDGVSYRMRHKLSKVKKEGPRVAAYPPIPGFADPPLFTPEPPGAAGPKHERKFWEVHIEGVTAHVRELWILEYRYLGPGLARGSFTLRPTQFYEVSLATLKLDGGRLTLGEDAVAEQAKLDLACRVEGSDPERLTGLEPLNAISAHGRGAFEGTNFAFLTAYLEPHAGLRARGQGRWTVSLELDHGELEPGSNVTFESRAFSLGDEHVAFNGGVALSARRVDERDEHGRGRGALKLALSMATLRVGADVTTPWNATLVSPDWVVQTKDSEQLHGTAALRLDSALAFLPLLTSSALWRGVEAKLLGLGVLDAHATFHLGDPSRLELVSAQSGSSSARGALEGGPSGAHGAFLLRTPLLNFGVRVSKQGTELTPFAGKDWLTGAPPAAQTGGAPTPGAGRFVAPTAPASASPHARAHAEKRAESKR